MSAQPAESPAPPRSSPAKTLDAVVRVMTGDVDDDFRERFQDALAKAWAKARAESSLEPLTALVESWWPYACQWCDPAYARAYYADIDRWVRDGIRESERNSPADVYAEWERLHPGRKLNISF